MWQQILDIRAKFLLSSICVLIALRRSSVVSYVIGLNWHRKSGESFTVLILFIIFYYSYVDTRASENSLNELIDVDSISWKWNSGRIRTLFTESQHFQLDFIYSTTTFSIGKVLRVRIQLGNFQRFQPIQVVKLCKEGSLCTRLREYQRWAQQFNFLLREIDNRIHHIKSMELT